MKVKHIASRNFAHLDLQKLRQGMQSEWSIVAGPDESALSLAKHIDEGRGDVIFVMESPAEALGIVVPKQLMEGLREHLDIREPSFERALEVFGDNPVQRRREFEHEWVRQVRVDLEWCRRGKHYAVPPCLRHPN